MPGGATAPAQQALRRACDARACHRVARSSARSVAARAAAASSAPRLAQRRCRPTPRPTAAPLRFPADFGAHPRCAHRMVVRDRRARRRRARRGASRSPSFAPRRRSPAPTPSRFAARQLLFAHGAVTDLAARRLRHDQRIARSGFGIAEASVATPALVLRDWRLTRSGGAGASRYAAHAASDSAGFAFDLELAATQPVLLQGVDGVSRKGPRPRADSRYYSEPQLAVRGTLASKAESTAVAGRAWLDHEWSDAYLDPDAVGWDWIGMNLDDGSALMAFRMRRADGSTLWSGGSHRRAGGATRDFADGEVVLHAGPRLDQPGIGGALSGRVAGRDAGRRVRRARAARRPGARQPRPAPARSTGKAWRCSSTPRGRARRPRLPRDDRLRRAPRPLTGCRAALVRSALSARLRRRRRRSSPASSPRRGRAGRRRARRRGRTSR